MANLCIKTPSSASLVLIFQLLVLRPRPSVHNTPSNSCAAEYLEHSCTSTLLTYVTGRVYNVHQVQNIWSARAQEQGGARA